MDRRAKNRSAVTNGTRMFLGSVPGTSEIARRYADFVLDLETERGGKAALSTIQREAVRAYAGLAVRLEQIHAEMAAGAAVDPEALGQLGDRMDRQARRMGPVKAIERRGLLEQHTTARRPQ